MNNIAYLPMQSVLQHEKGASTERLNIRIEPQQKKLIELACKITNLDKSKFIIQSSLARAEKIINSNTTIYLNEEEFSQFNQALQLSNQNVTERHKKCLKKLLQKPRPWE